MTKLRFVTSNSLKFQAAHEVCIEAGVSLSRANLELLEIQADNGQDIARHKAAAAYKSLQTPLVVSDDTWIIPGLRGFPGPYMKYMNEWFTPADFLHLTSDLTDRRIILRQEVVYQDGSQQVAFAVDTICQLLREIRGESKFSHLTVTSLDGKRSLAEIVAAGGTGLAGTVGVWHKFSDWINSKSNA